MSTIAPPPVLFTIPVLVDSAQNLNNSSVLIPDGMLAKVAGSNQFKVGTGDKSWSDLPWQTLTFENGLIEKDGIVSVDFSQMPTDKFEALLKQLNLKIWLTEDTDVYINADTGSDVLSEGRGLSEDKAFKTIQACIDYVSSNLDFSNHRVTLYIQSGTYSGFSCYKVDSGILHIKGIGTTKPIIKNFEKNACAVLNNGTYIIENLRLECLAFNTSSDISNRSFFALSLNVYSNATIIGIELYGATSGQNNNSKIYNWMNLLYINSYSICYLGGNYDSRIKIELHKNWSTAHCITVTNNSKLYGRAATTNSEGTIVEVWGEFVVFMNVNNSSAFSKELSIYNTTFVLTSGKTATGARYEVSSLSFISTNGSGANYFPGSTAGTVNTTQYAWYS